MSCICPTRNRRQWLPKAISCFQAQTYRQRELLILADGESVRDLIPDDDSIQLLELSGAAQIGEKRNLACSRARGEIIAHWDDDDYSDPRRLEDQVQRLLTSRKAVTAYRTMRFTNGQKWWLYNGSAQAAVGTSLCYRRDWWRDHPFQSLQVGEDAGFAATANAKGQLVVCEAGDLMHATIHPQNTSPRSLSGPSWIAL